MSGSAFSGLGIPTSLIGAGFTVLSLIMILIIAIFCCIGMVVTVLIYNLIARMKGDIHFGMVEIGMENSITDSN